MNRIEQQVKVLSVNPDGKKFAFLDRVNLKGTDVDIIVDVKPDLFKLVSGSELLISLQHTFDEDKDAFDYTIHGKLYKVEAGNETDQVLLYVSFGGMLSCFKCTKAVARSYELHQKLYLLMRRV